MKVCKTQEALRKELEKHAEQSIGFVPTMGALHRGHTSLLVRSGAENDITVCSIFINPTQFNNPIDLAKYPIQVEDDIETLKKVGCDILYLPQSVEDVYRMEEEFTVDLGSLDKVMEGVNRPGHFQGVMRVVKLLLELVKPTKAYFGLKDYQQYLIIKEMVSQLNMSVSIIGCDIVREADGLAMSSRNQLLTLRDRRLATALIKTLRYAGAHYSVDGINELEKQCIAMLNQYGEPEYFVIRRADNLEKIEPDYRGEVRAFTVCSIGKVRLIDNYKIK